MTVSSTPGWYHAEGDAPDTARYWDGAAWVGEPVAQSQLPGLDLEPEVTVARREHAIPPPPSWAADHTAGAPANPHDPRLASAGSRIGARSIDIVLWLIVAAVLSSLISDAAAWVVAGLAIWVIEWSLVAFKGGTVGKLMLGLRVVDHTTGAEPKVGQSGLRTGMRLVGAFAGPGFGGPGVSVSLIVGVVSFALLFSDGRRTVMDEIANTHIVRLHLRP